MQLQVGIADGDGSAFMQGSSVDEASFKGSGLREILWLRGPGGLTEQQLLAVLLGTGRRGVGVMALAQEVWAACGKDGLLGLSAPRLARLVGIGPAKAARVVAAIELGRRAVASPLRRGQRLQNPTVVARTYGPRLSGESEHFIVVHLDARHRVLAETVVARGGVDRCPVPVREIFSAALEQGAAAIICVHNHPSGDPEPSVEDRNLTERLVAAGRLVGVAVLDHVVVAGSRYHSFRERGPMDG